MCFDTMNDYAIVPCTHTGRICGSCVTNMVRFNPAKDEKKARAFSRGKTGISCPFCKSDWRAVILTSSPPEVDTRLGVPPAFPHRLPPHFVPRLRLHADTAKLQQKYMEKTTIYCPICEEKFKKSAKSGSKRPPRFRFMGQLDTHLERTHNLRLCMACVSARKLFVSEAKLFTKNQLVHHCKKGAPGVGPHPFCHFCREPYFGKDDLFAHYENSHLQCAFCNKTNPNQRIYFRNRKALRSHYAAEHYLCEHPMCTGLAHDVAFQNELELRSHCLAFHVDTSKWSRAQRRQASVISAGVAAGSSDVGNRGRRRGRRSGRDVTLFTLDSDDERETNDSKVAEAARERLRANLEARYTSLQRARSVPAEAPRGATEAAVAVAAGRVPPAAPIRSRTLDVNEEFPALSGDLDPMGVDANTSRFYRPVNNVENFPVLSASSGARRSDGGGGGGSASRRGRRRRQNQSTQQRHQIQQPAPRPTTTQPTTHPTTQTKAGRSQAEAAFQIRLQKRLAGSGLPAACPETDMGRANEAFQKHLQETLGGDVFAFNAIRKATAGFMRGYHGAAAFVRTYAEYCEDRTPLRELVSLVRAKDEAKAIELYELIKPGPGAAAAFAAAAPIGKCAGCGVSIPTEQKTDKCARCRLVGSKPTPRPPPAGTRAVNLRGTGLRAGMLVVAQYSSDGCWYEAVVEKGPGAVGRPGYCQVRFQGYGNTETQPITTIRMPPAAPPRPAPVRTAPRAAAEASFPALGGNDTSSTSLDEKKKQATAAASTWSSPELMFGEALATRLAGACTRADIALDISVLFFIFSGCETALRRRGRLYQGGIAGEVPSVKRSGVAAVVQRMRFSRLRPTQLVDVRCLLSFGLRPATRQSVDQIRKAAAMEGAGSGGVGPIVKGWMDMLSQEMSASDAALLHQYLQMVLLRVAEEASSLPKGTVAIGSLLPKTQDSGGGGRKSRKKRKQKKRILYL